MKTIKFTWNRNPEQNVTAYRINVVGVIDAQVDANGPLEFVWDLTEGNLITAQLFAIGSIQSGLSSSDPAELFFVVPSDNAKPSIPTGFGWEVINR